jgi:hypothetical protein
VADAGDEGVEVRGGGEAEGTLAEVAGGNDFGGEDGWGIGGRGGIVEEKRLAGRELFGRAAEGAPEEAIRRVGRGGKLLGEEDFDAAGGCGRAGLGGGAGAGGEEARGQDAGVVEDEEVARRR